MLTFKLPSIMRYSNSGLIRATEINFINFVSWYLGIDGLINEDIERNLLVNNHTLLIEDKQLRERIQNYLDINKIPEKYKRGKSYYNEAENIFLFPNYELDPSNPLNKDQSILAELLKKVSHPTVSPLFAEQKDLLKLPKAYIVVVEWDCLKDEGLLYAERLRKAGVDVELKFYENAFHGIASLIDHHVGYELARDMLDDLISYLKSNI